MNDLTENDFSNIALENLKAEIDYHFNCYKSYEVLRTDFIKKPNGSVWADSLVRTNGKYGHRISLEFSKNSENWSNTDDNFIRHLD